MIGKAEIDLKQVFSLVGFFLIIEGTFMLLGLPFAFYYHDKYPLALFYSFLITSGSGGIILYLARDRLRETVNKREGFLIVTSTWLAISLFGTLPFLISRAIPSFTDAFFETM